MSGKKLEMDDNLSDAHFQLFLYRPLVLIRYDLSRLTNPHDVALRTYLYLHCCPIAVVQSIVCCTRCKLCSENDAITCKCGKAPLYVFFLRLLLRPSSMSASRLLFCPAVLI